VKRQFGNDGLKLAGVVIEAANGSREFVNVDVEINKLDNATKSWVINGLQTLLAEGRSVQFNTVACGAAGRVQYLDAVRQSSQSGG
jgi:hypothetical protein